MTIYKFHSYMFLQLISIKRLAVLKIKRSCWWEKTAKRTKQNQRNTENDFLLVIFNMTSHHSVINPSVGWRPVLTPSSAVSFLLFFTFSGSSFLTLSMVLSEPNSFSKSLQDSSSISRSSFSSQLLMLLLASSKICRHFCSLSGSSIDSSNLA